MPGVKVVTATRTGRSAVVQAPSGQFFVAGLAQRGSTDAPSVINSLADFEALFGDRVSYSHLHDTIQTFFEEGGTRAYVIRVAGASASKGTVTLLDAAAGDSIVVTANSYGAWSSDLSLVVSNTGTKIDVKYLGDIVETFTGANVAALIASANSSQYVVLTAGGSGIIPVDGTFSVSAGNDQHGAAVTADYVNALALFDKSLGDGSVAIPGIGEDVHAGLIAHASTHNRIALLDMAETATINDLTTQAGLLNSEYAGLFAPWVEINTVSGTRYIPPVGYIAAVRNRIHESDGAFKASAGAPTVARFLTGLRFDYNQSYGDVLDAGKVNAIRFINNTIRNYGWRSLSDDIVNYALITGRDVLNRLVVECEASLEDFVFQTIDGKGHLLADVNSAIVSIVEPMKQAGGLYELVDATGKVIDPGYKVETGNNINTLASLSTNEIKAKLSVRVSPSAALISVTIVKVGLISGL